MDWDISSNATQTREPSSIPILTGSDVARRVTELIEINALLANLRECPRCSRTMNDRILQWWGVPVTYEYSNSPYINSVLLWQPITQANCCVVPTIIIISHECSLSCQCKQSTGLSGCFPVFRISNLRRQTSSTSGWTMYMYALISDR